jgi:hypothetical protein
LLLRCASHCCLLPCPLGLHQCEGCAILSVVITAIQSRPKCRTSQHMAHPRGLLLGWLLTMCSDRPGDAVVCGICLALSIPQQAERYPGRKELLVIIHNLSVFPMGTLPRTKSSTESTNSSKCHWSLNNTTRIEIQQTGATQRH